MANWMRKLGLHYETMRALYPEDPLMIVFDIDGTIIDMRHMILHALNKFDKKNRSSYFKKLSLKHITVDENTVGRLLIEMKIPADVRGSFLEWYKKYRTTSKAVMESHKPFHGVMDVIKWFYDQDDTYIGLNTGRPETIRKVTLRLLNKIGRQYDMSFDDQLLFMNPYDWNTKCTGLKAEGMDKFRRMGYRIFAFIDNEPENLLSVSGITNSSEIMLLHAETIYKSSKDMLPLKAVSGDIYDVNSL